MAVLAGVETHDVLRHLASLGGRHRGQRELARKVAGGVDVLDVRLEVVVHGHVATFVDVHAGRLEPEPLGVGHRADGQQGVRAGNHTAVVALDDDAVVLHGHAGGARPLVEHDAGAEEVRLQGRRHLGVLARQHLLAAHDEADLGPESPEHVHELHAGHARADDDEVLGHLGRRIGLAGDHDAPAVDLGPVRYPRSAAAPKSASRGGGILARVHGSASPRIPVNLEGPGKWRPGRESNP